MKFLKKKKKILFSSSLSTKTHRICSKDPSLGLSCVKPKVSTSLMMPGRLIGETLGESFYEGCGAR